MTGIGTTVCDMLEPNRIEIALSLEGRVKSARDLSEGLQLSRRAAAKQLGILRASGIVDAEMVDRVRHYRLTPKGARIVAGIKAIANA